MKTARRLLATMAAMMAFAVMVQAQESTSDWIRRILDPATIGVKPYPESQLNRKITVDTIRYAEPSRRIAIYMTDLDKMKPAADYFTETLGVKPAMNEPGSPRERYEFKLTGGGKYPPAAEGLNIEIMRSPWVDGKAQITMLLVVKK